MRYLIEHYKKGIGIIEKFPSVNTLSECKQFVNDFCTQKNLTIVATERCDNATWCYLNDGSEIDYCLE